MRVDRTSEELATGLRKPRAPRRSWVLLIVLLTAAHVACRSDEEKLAGFKEQAEAYAEQEKFKEAVIEYRNVLQIDPNDADGHRGLAKAYLALGSVADAYWELSETIRLDPSDRESRNTYAAISLANQRYDAVLEQADALLADDPDDPVGLVLRAQAYERLDRIDDVEPIMLQLIAAEPEKTEYRLLLSNFYMRQGRPEDARVQAEAAMEAKPTYAAASQMVRLTAIGGDPDEVVERYLRLAIDLANAEYAQHVELQDGGVDGRTEAYRTAASFYVSRERLDPAIAILEESQEALVDSNENRMTLMYMLASLYRESGDEDKATELMQRAAESDEGNPEPYITLSTYRTSQEDFAGAFEAAEQAMAIDPSNIKSRLRYAESLVEYAASVSDQEKLGDSRQIIDGLLQESPGLPEALFVLAKLSLAEGDFDAAIKALGSALEARPDWPQARMLLGTALRGKGELARARVEMALALELDPSLVVARRGLVRIHSALNEHEYAVDQGKIYLRERPKDVGTRVVVAQSLIRLGRIDEAGTILQAIPEDERNAISNFAIARIELANGNRAEARRLLESVDAAMPHNVRVLESYVSLDQAEGRMEETEARLAAAVAAAPNDAQLQALQGLVARLQGDLALAQSSYERAIELDPTMLTAYSKLADIYNSQGLTDQTIAIYEKAVVANPKSADAHHYLAVMYEITGKRELAVQQYDLAIASGDDAAESKNNLAYLLASSGQDLDRALTLAQEAKAAMPSSPNASDTLGWVLLKRGVPSAAIGYFREALANLPPGNPARSEVQYHLGLAYVAAKQNEDAVGALEEALQELDKQLDAARAAGGQVGEPPWASQARAEIQKLAAG